MAQSSDEPLANPEDFVKWLPRELCDALTTWAQSYSCKLRLREPMYGASGSHVAHVEYEEEHGGTGNRVLKLVQGDKAGARESHAAQMARERSPKEFRDHLIETQYFGPLRSAGWWVHLQRVAGSGITETRPLSNYVNEPDFGEHCEKIMLSLAENWNYGRDAPSRRQSAGDFLKNPLGGMRPLTANLDGQLPGNLSRSGADLRFTWPREWGGGELPNPMALMKGRFDGSIGEVRIFLGNGHGDLHPGNILIPVFTEASFHDYILVDLGRFSVEMPLSRDPMKLLLSLAESWIHNVSAGPLFRKLAEAVVAPFSRSYERVNDIQGYLEISKKIHGAARKWAAERGAGGDWDRQNLLVLIFSALRYASRPELGEDVRRWFFGVAALATRDLLGVDVLRDKVATGQRPPHQDPLPGAAMTPPDERSTYGNQDRPQGVFTGQADLMPEQYAVLQDAVAVFNKFVALEDSPGHLSGNDPDTAILLHLPEVDEQLRQLREIIFVNIPDVRWVSRIARAVVHSQECSRRFGVYGGNEHERTMLRAAIRELRDLISDRYPSLLILSRRKKEAESIGELTLKS